MIHIIYLDNYGIKKKKIFESSQIEFMKFWFKKYIDSKKYKFIDKIVFKY